MYIIHLQGLEIALIRDNFNFSFNLEIALLQRQLVRLGKKERKKDASLCTLSICRVRDGFNLEIALIQRERGEWVGDGFERGKDRDGEN